MGVRAITLDACGGALGSERLLSLGVSFGAAMMALDASRRNSTVSRRALQLLQAEGRLASMIQGSLLGKRPWAIHPSKCRGIR